MKKLMTVMASAATALFAIGAVNGDEVVPLLNATSFELLNAGDPLDVEKADNGQVGDTFWAMDTIPINDNGTVVSNEAANASSRPDYFENATTNRTLHLDTSTALYRTVKPNATTNDAAGKVCWKDKTGEAIGGGIYLDTLVKFTAADDVFGDDALAAGDKIAISYVEQSDEVADPITNFVIRAGYIGENEITAKNYEAKLVLPNDAEFDKDSWHRLTVRTIQSIDAETGGNVGFVVYVDKVPLVYAKAKETIGDNVKLVGVAAMLGNSVFPSAVASGGNGGTTITAASFSGTGAIDDVVFTKKMPNFIAASSAVPVSITLGTGVTGVTVTVGQETINPVDDEATPLVFNLPAGTTSFSLGYELGDGFADFEAESDDATFEYTSGSQQEGTVSFGGVSLAFSVKASRNNFTYLDDNDVLQSAVTLTDAIKYVKDGGTIKLAYDYKVADFESFSADHEERYVIDEKGITLDLNGKTLDGGENDDYALFFVGGTMTVIDSATGGKIIYGGSAGVFYMEGTLTVGATSGDNGVYIDGLLFADGGEGDIVRANINVADNSKDDAFLWGGQVVTGSDTADEPVNGYWVVAPQGVLGTYNVTVDPTANATYAAAYKVGGAAITPANDVLTVTVGQTIVITATPAANYEYATTPDGWTAGQDGAITIEVSAAGTVAIPAPTPTTYTVTVMPTENAEYSAVYTDEGNEVAFVSDVATVVSGKSITITARPAEDYEYATTPDGWTAGQNGVITIVVSEAGTVVIPEPTEKQQSEYPSYIDENVAYKSAYDTWKTNNNVAAGDNKYEAAFLLNIAPDAADQTLEPVSITISGSTVTITANKNLEGVNGKVYVKTATTLAGLASAEWAEATVDETTGAVKVTPGESDTAGFYKIKVDF